MHLSRSGAMERIRLYSMILACLVLAALLLLRRRMALIDDAPVS